MSTTKNFGRDLLDKVRNGRMSVTFTILAALSIGILAGSVLTSNVSAKNGQQVDSSDARPLTIPNPVTLSNGFSQIVKQVGPAVVNINTESIPKPTPRTGRRNRNNGNSGNGDNGQGDMQDFFNKFFGQGNGEDDGSGSGSPFDGQGTGKREALGSGFIVDPRGYIITNNHVVDKADKIYVRLSTDPTGGTDPGRPAKVIGVDVETDLAVIKIDAPTPLPTVKLGNSEGAQVGDWVLAIGSPFGLSQTVSAGIVSAKNREIDEPAVNGIASNQFQRFIQTDAAINPGNSGGPLVDMTGSVIGVNAAIYTQSAGSEGVGFAIPSNTVINVYNMLISPEHRVTRGSIGITFQAAESSAVGRVYGFANGGVMVGTVSPSGGAGKAGMQPGDVIVSLDGLHIKDGDDLVADISARHIGSSVKIGVLRDGKLQTLNVVIGDRAKAAADLDNKSSDEEPAPQAPDAGESKLGITVTAVPAQIAGRLNLKGGGVIITNVRTGSFGDEIALTKGNVITEINRHPVSDEASYRSIVGGLKPGDDVVFVIRDGRVQGGSNSYVGGTLP